MKIVNKIIEILAATGVLLSASAQAGFVDVLKTIARPVRISEPRVRFVNTVCGQHCADTSQGIKTVYDYKQHFDGSADLLVFEGKRSDSKVYDNILRYKVEAPQDVLDRREQLQDAFLGGLRNTVLDAFNYSPKTAYGAYYALLASGCYIIYKNLYRAKIALRKTKSYVEKKSGITLSSLDDKRIALAAVAAAARNAIRHGVNNIVYPVEILPKDMVDGIEIRAERKNGKMYLKSKRKDYEVVRVSHVDGKTWVTFADHELGSDEPRMKEFPELAVLERQADIAQGFLGAVRLPIVNAFQNHPIIMYGAYWSALAACTGYALYKNETVKKYVDKVSNYVKGLVRGQNKPVDGEPHEQH